MRFNNEIERLERKAVECRLDALRFVGRETKRLMIRLAETYDAIADAYRTIEERP